MKIAVLGAGAIGGMLTALLCEGGQDPLLIARGKTLETLQEVGLTFVEGGRTQHFTPRLGDARDPNSLVPQDLVFLATKAHQIDGALPALTALCGPETLIVTAINGVPWWFFQRSGGAQDGAIIESVDPNGSISATLDPDRLIGCAVYMAAEVKPPFTIESAGVRRLILGTVNGSARPAPMTKASEALEGVGLTCTWSETIRADVMNKLMGNLWANPLSVVVEMNMVDMVAQPVVAELGIQMMREFETLCAAMKITLPLTPEERMQGAAGLGAFRTSMLQDLDRGRAIELDAILSAPLEMAQRLDTPHEAMRLVHGLTQARGISSGSYQPNARPRAGVN